MGPGTLYRTIQRLVFDGFVEEVTDRRLPTRIDAGPHDARRRYYRLTPTGRKAAGVRARRLDRLLRAARDRGLLDDGSPEQTAAGL